MWRKHQEHEPSDSYTNKRPRGYPYDIGPIEMAIHEEESLEQFEQDAEEGCDKPSAYREAPSAVAGYKSRVKSNDQDNQS